MSAKLDNPKSVPKTCWSIISKFLSNKKISIIPPILVNGELVSDFKQKTNIFDNHLPLCVLLLKMVANYLVLVIKKRITSFDIKGDDILLIIKNLNVNEAHRWDQLSIRMIKSCGNSIS